jgi:hypothetical protein
MAAPTASELQAQPVVQAAFAAAWADSFPDDPTMRHEEGGYIYCNTTTGDVTSRRAPPGTRKLVDLSYPPSLPGYYLVATYHTHPNPPVDGYDPTPSDADIREADGSSVPWLVIAEEAVYVAGPDQRVGGGFRGDPGYPI